ncbi:MAG: GGDEF domain-containing protein [Acidimicrobiales bacterium]
MNPRLLGLTTAVVGALGAALALISGSEAWAILSALAAISAGVALVMFPEHDPDAERQVASLEAELDALRLAEEERAAELAEDTAPAGTPISTDVARSRSSLTDAETGLFSEEYMHVALEARIASARRNLRPVAVALVDVVNDPQDPNDSRAVPRGVAASVIETIRESDTASRLESGVFAMVLEDTPENGAVWTMERLRRKLSDANPDCTVWAGVACYPAHALDPDEMLQKAELALAAAAEWSQDRIEVAVAAQ